MQDLDVIENCPDTGFLESPVIQLLPMVEQILVVGIGQVRGEGVLSVAADFIRPGHIAVLHLGRCLPLEHLSVFVQGLFFRDSLLEIKNMAAHQIEVDPVRVEGVAAALLVEGFPLVIGLGEFFQQIILAAHGAIPIWGDSSCWVRAPWLISQFCPCHRWT